MNRKVYQHSFLILLLVLVLAFVGCQGKKEVEKPAPTVETKVETPQTKTEEKPSMPDTITLTDNAGREVTIKHPVTRAAVSSRYDNELIRACGAIDKVIAVDLNTAQDREYWSQFDPNNTIGKGQRELNYEKIAEFQPEILILPKNGSVEEAEAKLKDFGIPVFVISGYDTSDFKNQIENIGKIFGTEEKAKEFFDYFQSRLDEVKGKIKDEEKKTLYFESTHKLHSTLPGDYYYDMAEFAGAKNIFAEDYEGIKKSEIDPEEVVKRNPDVIVKLVTPKKAIKGSGLYEPPTKEEFLEAYQEMISRPGWDEISAVKNKQIFFMTQFSHGGASKLVGTMYIADKLYHDKLPSIDSKEVFRKWMEDFQGFKNIEGHFYSVEELEN